jgi:glycosyltransferase involved in cell wall biosynthesis
MRIGVDATCWHNNRGYGRHARALLSALVRLDTSNRYTFFLDLPDLAGTIPPEVDTRLLKTSAPTVLAAAANGRRTASDMFRMSRALSDASLDVLLFPTIYSYVPTFTRARKLVMIHDVIAETYPHLTLPRLSARMFWKTKVALGRWQADAIVTVSEFSRRGIVERFGMRPELVFVAGEASDPVFRRVPGARSTPRLEALGVDPKRPMIVYVGGFSPHKNLEALVEAFGKLPDSGSLLVMVGDYEKEVFHSYFGTVKAQVKKLGIENRVIFTGYLPDEELVILLNLAAVLALPSLMEGFGLPAIEAAACGCPVIATKASPLPELLGDGGLYIDPQRDSLERALRTILDSPDLRESMSNAGMAAAARLTWDAAARQMMRIIRSVAA